MMNNNQYAAPERISPPNIKQRHKETKKKGQIDRYNYRYNKRQYLTPRGPPDIKISYREFKIARKEEKMSKLKQQRNEAIALIGLLKIGEDNVDKLYLSIPTETIKTLGMMKTPRFVLDELAIQKLLQTGSSSITKTPLLNFLEKNKDKVFVLNVCKAYTGYFTYTINVF